MRLGVYAHVFMPVPVYVCVCVCCTGFRLPAAGLGDRMGVERQLGPVEGRSVCHAADREHGEHCSDNVQETPQAQSRTQGQFTRDDSQIIGFPVGQY